MIPAIVLTYFCFEPQSGKRVKKSAAGAGVLLKNYAYMAFLIFAFFFQMSVAFEANFLTYYMADIQIDTVNLGLILSVRAMMEIPFLFFIGRLRRYIKMKYLIMLSAILMATECLCFTALATVHFSARARTISMSLHPWSCVPRRTACSFPWRKSPAFSATCSAAFCLTPSAAKRSMA